MSKKYRFTENEVPLFITMTLVEWIDYVSSERMRCFVALKAGQSPGYIKSTGELRLGLEDYKYSSAGIYADEVGVFV